LLLTVGAASNALVEVPDASTLAWTDFKFNSKDLLNVQSPDIFFQNREACNPWYIKTAGIVIDNKDLAMHVLPPI